MVLGKRKAPYGDAFYARQAGGSYASARIVLRLLWKYCQPQAVLDVGCGRGTWLKACAELGATRLVGIDGAWSSAQQMCDPMIAFMAVDLNRGFSVPGRFDLAMCLEVAEHLQEASAAVFVASLTAASDVVLFSAAFTDQGGIGHVNEQPHSYWAALFARHGYAAFDLFRPALWGNEEICVWYRQNTFLYVKAGAPQHGALARRGIAAVAHLSFMDAIHPVTWRDRVASGHLGFRRHVSDLVPSLYRGLKHRLRA